MKVHVEGGIKVRPLDLLCMTENTVGIRTDKVWYVTEIDGRLLHDMIEELGESDVNMGHLIINYVTIMLASGKWCNPVH